MIIPNQVYNKIRENRRVYVVENRFTNGCPKLSTRNVVYKNSINGEWINITTKEAGNEALLFSRVFTSRREAKQLYKKKLLEFKERCLEQRDSVLKTLGVVDRKLEEVEWKLSKVSE